MQVKTKSGIVAKKDLPGPSLILNKVNYIGRSPNQKFFTIGTDEGFEIIWNDSSSKDVERKSKLTI